MEKVYVMGAGLDIKIGVSKDPKKRLTQLAIGNPTIELLYESEPLKNAYKVEAAMHRQLSDKGKGREWFSEISRSDVIAEVKKEVEKSGIAGEPEEIDEAPKVIIHVYSNGKMMSPEDALSEMQEENRKIWAEVAELERKLLSMGWTQEKIDALKWNAIKDINYPVEH